MANIEAVQLAVRRHIDAGLPLDVEHDASRIEACSIARQCGEPIRYRIRSDSRREDSGLAHLFDISSLSIDNWRSTIATE